MSLLLSWLPLGALLFNVFSSIFFPFPLHVLPCLLCEREAEITSRLPHCPSITERCLRNISPTSDSVLKGTVCVSELGTLGLVSADRIGFVGSGRAHSRTGNLLFGGKQCPSSRHHTRAWLSVDKSEQGFQPRKSLVSE